MSREALAEWLHEAADYIEKNGWWRGSLRGPNRKQVCSLGAILYCRGLTEGDENMDEVREVAWAICEALGIQLSEPQVAVNELVQWNDHAAKNKEEVVDLFRKAEKIAIGGFDPDKGVPL
jgi:hypothetical protein